MWLPLSFLLVLGFGVWLLLLTEQQRHSKPPEKLLTANPQGFIFGEYRRFLRKPQFFYKSEDTDGHILIIGGSGSGKTSSILLPSFPALRSTKFVIDVKGEIAAATAHLPGRRKIFNPMSAASFGYDPYYRLRGSDNPMQEAKEIAQILIPEPPNLKDPFWVRATQKLVTGFMLHYCNEGVSFADTMIEIVRRPIDLHVKDVLAVTGSTPAQYCLNGFVRKPERLDDFYTELTNEIMLFATDERVKALLCKPENISPLDLEEDCDVFLCVPEDKIDQWRPLTNLIINQFFKHFERRPEKTAKPITFIFEEAPRFGKYESVATGLNTLRSKNIIMCLIAQSLAQFDMIYGEAQRKTIFDNCTYQAILGARDADTQEYFSRLVGTREVTRQGQSTNYAPDKDEERGHTVSQHIIDQRIIQPHEFTTLKDVVLLSPWGYHRAGKIRPVVG